MEHMEQVLKFLIRNAYIVVAFDGTSLMISGKKAAKHLSNNLINVIALNQITNLILNIARLLIVGMAAFVGFELISVSLIHKISIGKNLINFLISGSFALQPDLCSSSSNHNLCLSDCKQLYWCI
jgi:Plasma-membrane choline transporter